MEEHYHKLANMYKNAPINAAYLPDIKIKDGEAEISIVLKKDFFHAGNALHGAISFKMLDDAAVFAVKSKIKDAFVVTTSFNIHFLRPVNKGKVTAVGKLLFASRKYYIAEAKLYNDSGKEIAFGTGNFVKTDIPLSEELGYS